LVLDSVLQLGRLGQRLLRLELLLAAHSVWALHPQRAGLLVGLAAGLLVAVLVSLAVVLLEEPVKRASGPWLQPPLPRQALSVAAHSSRARWLELVGPALPLQLLVEA
jgi:hypothetical protein